jgi:uncharacterized protein
VVELAAAEPEEAELRPVRSAPGGDLGALRLAFLAMRRVLVAFSGGADSAFVAWVANDTLGPDAVTCVTAVSPSLAPEELDDCRALAREWGLHHLEVETSELADPAYAANDGSRCYHCKTSLLDALAAVGSVSVGSVPAGSVPAGSVPAGSVSTGRETTGGSTGSPTVVLGVNLDDLGEHRPGQRAAAERGASFPLVDAGFTKADVRRWSRRLGLRTWDKPAAACLASRVPYGTRVTIGTLTSVAKAESALRSLGFTQLRVRHYGDTARIEVPVEELGRVVERRADVAGAVHGAGYRYVTLDLDGFRSGNLNDALAHVGAPAEGAAPLAGHAPGIAAGANR